MRHLLLFFLLLQLGRTTSILDQLNEVENPVFCCDPSNSNNSYIYCNGTLLMAVNYHRLYNDSKTFVDMPMLFDPDVTQNEFNKRFGNLSVEKIDPDQLQMFVDDYFSEAGSELEECTPPDWQENPSKFDLIVDPNLKKWALELNGIWKTLCKKIKPEVAQQSQKFSLIYVPNYFIAPGGRFREFYYWDAYWIIKGLLVSGMSTSAKNMISNLGSMVDRFGFVPNGGRVYYLQRSQPPLLAGMLYEYFEATRDYDFVTQMLPTVEKELNFWSMNRMVTVNVNGSAYNVYQYHTPTNVPRPESYQEDVRKAQAITNKAQFWQDVASAAESGWDFSTRWFSNKNSLSTIETTNVVPVDLNSYICWNMDILEYLHEKIGDFDKSETFRNMRSSFRNTVHKVFYNVTAGTWYDYNKRTGQHNTDFFPSMTIPLFTGCYNSLDQGKSERLFNLMRELGVFDYQSGIPTSMAQNSSEQWDFPNGWSPLNHMVIEGLRKSQNPQMQDQAFLLAKKWVLGNYRVWMETSHMWEKYDVIGTYPAPGSGGEYNVQVGFGWTNGVILDLLITYSDRLTVPEDIILITTNRVDQTTSRTTRSVPPGGSAYIAQSLQIILMLIVSTFI